MPAHGGGAGRAVWSVLAAAPGTATAGKFGLVRIEFQSNERWLRAVPEPRRWPVSSDVTSGSIRVISLRASHASCHGIRDTSSARTATARGPQGARRPHQWQVPSSLTTCRCRIRCALRHNSRSTTSVGQSASTRSTSFKAPPHGRSPTLGGSSPENVRAWTADRTDSVSDPGTAHRRRL